MEKGLIIEKANEILTKYGFKRPVDVVQLAESMGFVVGNAKMKKEEDGFILVNNDTQEILGVKTQKLIGVNRERDLFTKRFIIAHELGHYILHSKNKSIFAQREQTHGRTSEENDVDFFAACLLMPEEDFVKTASSIRCTYDEIDDYQLAKILSEQFKVPQLSAFRRLEETKEKIGKFANDKNK